MAKVIAISLQKGGVGKTTTALALATMLGYCNKKTLLIDMDSQCNTTFSSIKDEPNRTITDVLGDDCTIHEAIIKCKHYDLVAADGFLTNVEMAKIPTTLLKIAIEPIKESYDYIIIDTPPALGNLNYNSLVASDYVIVPTDARPFAIQGLAALNKTIKDIQGKRNPDLKILGILLVKYHDRSVLNRDLKEMIREFATGIGTTLFKTTIREGVAVPESQALRLPLIDYAKKSKPTQDYLELTKEILEMLGDEINGY